MKTEIGKQINAHQMAELIGAIASLTDANNHTGAVCALAEFAGGRVDVDEANQILTLHYQIGHMPMSLIMRRNSLRDRLMGRIAASHGWGNAIAVWDSF